MDNIRRSYDEALKRSVVAELYGLGPNVKPLQD